MQKRYKRIDVFQSRIKRKKKQKKSRCKRDFKKRTMLSFIVAAEDINNLMFV